MKGEIKNKYAEYINHIDFPAIMYIHENNKIIAMNGYAREIVGKDCDDIRDLFEGKKFKLPREISESGSKLVKNVVIMTNSKNSIEVDVDINVLKVDNVHFVLMLFEESFKKHFTSHMNIHINRVAWMYVDSPKIYMNQSLLDDVGIDDGMIFDMENHFDESVLNKIQGIKESIIDTGVCQYNSIQMIVKRDKSSHFIKANRMPIINSIGEIIGILNIHNKILDKDSNRKLYETVMKDINMQENEGVLNSAKIYKDILEHIESDIIVYSKKDEIIRYINDKTKQDYEAANIGNNIYEFFIEHIIEGVDTNIIKLLRDKKINNNIDTVVRDGFNNRKLRLRIKNTTWQDENDSVVLIFTETNRVDLPDKFKELNNERKILPDRIKFEFDVKNYIIKAIESNKNSVLMMFRIDDYKYIKYNVGALYAEALLKEIEHDIANEPILQKCSYKSRGAEFLILLENEEPDEIDQIILLLNEMFNKTRVINDKEINCKINIGITLFPKDGINPNMLIKNVDFAIFEAKKDEGTNYKYYHI